MTLVRTPDGLVHQILKPEDDGHWGKTFCDVLFTEDATYAETFAYSGGSVEGVSSTLPTTDPITCFTCVAKSDEL